VVFVVHGDTAVNVIIPVVPKLNPLTVPEAGVEVNAVDAIVRPFRSIVPLFKVMTSAAVKLDPRVHLVVSVPPVNVTILAIEVPAFVFKVKFPEPLNRRVPAALQVIVLLAPLRFILPETVIEPERPVKANVVTLLLTVILLHKAAVEARVTDIPPELAL
jgi:hypothetical protein